MLDTPPPPAYISLWYVLNRIWWAYMFRRYPQHLCFLISGRTWVRATERGGGWLTVFRRQEKSKLKKMVLKKCQDFRIILELYVLNLNTKKKNNSLFYSILSPLWYIMYQFLYVLCTFIAFFSAHIVSQFLSVLCTFISHFLYSSVSAVSVIVPKTKSSQMYWYSTQNTSDIYDILLITATYLPCTTVIC